MNEHRNANRETMKGISTLVRRADGTVLEGVVQDVSDGGVRISGDTAGLRVGETIDVVLVIRGEKIRYVCDVRHVESPRRSYGVHFQAGPSRPDSTDQRPKRCMKCSRDFAPECSYCSHCGQRLAVR